MILDNNLMFDSAAAVTSSAPSTNVIDLGAFRDMGIGDDPSLGVLVQVGTAFTTTNSATLQVAFEGSDTNTGGATWTKYAESDALAASVLTAGARLFDITVPRPAPGAATPRYLRMYYTVGTGVFGAGTVTAGIVLGREDMKYYPPGVTVSN